MLTGGCFCGRIRYEIDGVPFNATICHCTDCRRVTAAPMIAWFSVIPAGLRFVVGKPKYFTSSAQATRGFCPDCGTPLTFHHVDLPDEIDVTTCSLDDPDLVPPRDHTRTNRRLSWVQVADGLPAYPVARPAG